MWSAMDARPVAGKSRFAQTRDGQGRETGGGRTVAAVLSGNRNFRWTHPSPRRCELSLFAGAGRGFMRSQAG